MSPFSTVFSSISGVAVPMRMWPVVHTSSTTMTAPGMLALVAEGVFYYVFNYVVAFAMEKWEQALRYYR